MDTVFQGITVASGENGRAALFASKQAAQDDIDEDADLFDGLDLFPLEVTVDHDGSIRDALSCRPIFNPYV